MREMFIFQKVDSSVSWLSPPELPMLKSNEVHVWRISLEMTPHQVGVMEQLLSADELERAERFRFQKDRDHFIVARGMLKSVLGKYLNMQPDRLKFDYGLFGKPRLEEKTNQKKIQFNISHSRDLALCAVAQKREVGVDLEYSHADHSFESIAEQFFSKQEAAVLNSCPEHLRLRLFLKLWTRKEACLKAQGRGLVVDPNKIDVCSVREDACPLIQLNETALKTPVLSFRDLDIGADYAAAVAAEGNDWTLKYWQGDSRLP
jgi:4'-phosphopantetheinyl transferase